MINNREVARQAGRLRCSRAPLINRSQVVQHPIRLGNRDLQRTHSFLKSLSRAPSKSGCHRDVACGVPVVPSSCCNSCEDKSRFRSFADL